MQEEELTETNRSAPELRSSDTLATVQRANRVLSLADRVRCHVVLARIVDNSQAGIRKPLSIQALRRPASASAFVLIWRGPSLP